MIVQIYEIQTPHEAETMVQLGVDHVGSVLTSKEHWQDETLKSAIQAAQSNGRKSSLIPLFGQVDTLCKSVDYYRPDILHFCETLPPQIDGHRFHGILSLQQTMRDRFPELDIMRSIPISMDGSDERIPSLKYASLFEPWSDWFLTDTLLGGENGICDHEQPVKGFVGITGKPCHWDTARKLVRQSRIPVILAGGIGPDNVSRGIAHVSPAGVDSCTLTNAVDADGRVVRFQKDPEKVRAMVEKAKNLRVK
jgi:phosphoribosylanthranilate isomerase